MSFFGEVRTFSLTDPPGASREAVLAFKGFGLSLAAGCLALVWLAQDDAQAKFKSTADR